MPYTGYSRKQSPRLRCYYRASLSGVLFGPKRWKDKTGDCCSKTGRPKRSKATSTAIYLCLKTCGARRRPRTPCQIEGTNCTSRVLAAYVVSAVLGSQFFGPFLSNNFFFPFLIFSLFSQEKNRKKAGKTRNIF